MANLEWTDMFPTVVFHHLQHSFSGHYPILLDIDIESKNMYREVFRFKAWWVKEKNCVDEIRRLWQVDRGAFLKNSILYRLGS